MQKEVETLNGMSVSIADIILEDIKLEILSGF